MNLKPLVRWATFQRWTLRYTERSAERASGIFTTPDGEVGFRYDCQARAVHLPDRSVQLNEHGWEVNNAGETRFSFKSTKSKPNE
jgi:hypothetical protein